MIIRNPDNARRTRVIAREVPFRHFRLWERTHFGSSPGEGPRHRPHDHMNRCQRAVISTMSSKALKTPETIIRRTLGVMQPAYGHWPPRSDLQF